MTEIAQLFESALRQNRANLLRKAAMNTVAKMPADTTLRELLDSDARDAVCRLTLRDLREALGSLATPRKQPRKTADEPQDRPASREERVYKQILDALEEEPLTVGQLAKRIELPVDELRGYLSWMKRKGKIASIGRGRATRYQVAR
jgi:predicted Rossmann fold nucleotide-binding protein DprA/Smf involved in DNA uptake